MYGFNRPGPQARYNSYHGPKQRVLGNSAAQVPPAWRTGQPAAGPSSRSPLLGSKILLSQLPADVGEREVEELFKKTVGPLKDSFVIYNSTGRSKGMAVVWFQRPGDAVIAQQKYDGKFVDGKKPIKIEIISDSHSVQSATSAPAAPAAPKQTPSLFDRIEKKTPTGPASTSTVNGKPQNHNLPRQAAAAATIAASTSQAFIPAGPAAPRNRKRVKKGPKRLKKFERQPKSAQELDQEMDDYNAAGIPDIS